MVVVDTNVAVVANGRSRQASQDCARNCADRLYQITNGAEKLALDDKWRIIVEYRNNLRSSGQPGVGDAFLKWVLTNRTNPSCCEQVTITPVRGACGGGFREFPDDPLLAGFDPSDRKFVAVSVAHPRRPPILNATDSDWWDYREALARNGVKVDFLCRELFSGPV